MVGAIVSAHMDGVALWLGAAGAEKQIDFESGLALQAENIDVTRLLLTSTAGRLLNGSQTFCATK